MSEIRPRVIISSRSKVVGELNAQVVAAIRLVQAGVRWKPGKDRQHLQKRIALGHLQPGAQLDDYEAAISALVHNVAAEVYVYVFDDRIYPVVVGTVGNQCWLAMFSPDGVMETASHWWWYLDVLVQLPALPVQPTETEPVLA